MKAAVFYGCLFIIYNNSKIYLLSLFNLKVKCDTKEIIFLTAFAFLFTNLNTLSQIDSSKQKSFH